MKKLTVLILVVCVFMMSACGKKVALNDAEISSRLTNLGFDVNDISDSMEDSNINIVRTANNGKYQIEYYVFKSENAAKKAYKNNVNMFAADKEHKGSSKKQDNYDKYTQKTNSYYNSVVRTGKTLIYVSVNVDYKNDVNKVLNKLGY